MQMFIFITFLYIKQVFENQDTNQSHQLIYLLMFIFITFYSSQVPTGQQHFFEELLLRLEILCADHEDRTYLRGLGHQLSFVIKFDWIHTRQNPFNNWTKILNLAMYIFDLKMIVKSGLEFFILKFTETHQSCFCPVQKNLPRKTELARHCRQVSTRYL